MDSFFARLAGFSRDRLFLALCGGEGDLRRDSKDSHPDSPHTYGDLCDLMREKSELLKTIPPHSTVAILGGFDLDSIAFLLAAARGKMTIAPLLRDDSEAESKLFEAQIEYVYCDCRLTKTPQRRTNALFERLGDCAGLVLFSSGSTGKPKAIVHNFDALLESYAAKKPRGEIRVAHANIAQGGVNLHGGGGRTASNTTSAPRFATWFGGGGRTPENTTTSQRRFKPRRSPANPANFWRIAAALPVQRILRRILGRIQPRISRRIPPRIHEQPRIQPRIPRQDSRRNSMRIAAQPRILREGA